MTILVTGAEGQVGSAIQEMASIQNIAIYTASRQTLDISQPDAIDAFFKTHPDITAVINAAAYTAVDLAEDEPEKAYAINALGPKFLAQMCQKYNVPLLHISTDYVFSGDKIGEYLETDETAPLGVYGQTKLEGEQFIAKGTDNYLILRVSWVFGKTGKNFVKTIVRLAREREELKIVSDQMGYPTSADSIAKTLLTLAPLFEKEGKQYAGVYHYRGNKKGSWYEFATEIVEAMPEAEKKLKTLLPITTKAFPTKAKRPHNSALNCDKIGQVFGIVLEDYFIVLKAVIKEALKL
jgi:dTDP-4-dehydrorhamnose reductase